MAKNKHRKSRAKHSKETTKKEELKNNISKNETSKHKKKTKIAKQNEKEIKKVKKVKFKDKHPKTALIIKILIIVFILVAVIGAGIFIGAIYGAFGDEFEITVEELVEPASNSIIYDADGNVIAELNGDENRKNITLDEMSQYLANAYVAIEDERFEDHNGVDILRTGKAIVTFVLNGGSSSFGGSTITQQLVKNITKDDDDEGLAGITRKIKEWAKAYQIERLISKKQILELYLNTIFVGGQNYGVETGAYYYFNKSAKDLTLVECAFMAGINSAPNSYNPYGTKAYGENETKTNRINNKVKVVVNKMLELGYISQEERDAAINEVNEQGMKFTKGEKTTNYSYHTDALINELIEDLMQQKELSKAAAQNYIETQGLSIYSTESPTIQAAAEEAMANAKRINSSKNVDENGNAVQSQAAIVIIDHKTGYVLGCVGGLGEKTSRGLNRATQSLRQPGSTIKPISDVIPGLEEKIITAATLYNDNPTDFYVPKWNPGNQNDNYRGIISVRQAIETSQNIPFIKIMKELTPEKGIEYLEKMGVTTLEHDKDKLAAMSIGGLTNGISPLEMAAAYATIANNGIYIEPTFYTKVLDSDKNVVLESKQESRRAFSETTAYIAKDILTEPVQGASGTARRCAIRGMDVAAKTGTSNGDKDRWLCGFTNYYTAAVWYGYDDPETVVAGGISPATLIWSAAMSKVHQGLDSSRFKVPSNIITATICKDSGKLASDTCTNTYTEIFERGTIPQSCEGHTEYKICEETGLLANEYCTKIKTTQKTYLVEKEKMGLWTTSANLQENAIPDKTCETHKKPVEPEKPEETEKPSGSGDTENSGNTSGSETAGNSGNTNTNGSGTTENSGNTNTSGSGTTGSSGNTNTSGSGSSSGTDISGNTTKPSDNESTTQKNENDGGIGGDGDEAPPTEEKQETTKEPVENDEKTENNLLEKVENE